MHSICPVTFWKESAAQGWHFPSFSKLPASHFVQYVWPCSGCTEPAGHRVHFG